MSVLLLRLEGPLQAWSTQGRFAIRDTEREPTKSGVVGLLGAALGMSRDDDATLEALAALRMAIRVDREGTLLHDYQTAGGGTFRGRPYVVFGAKDCVPSHRYYVQDASFVAGLEGDIALLTRVAGALVAPRFPLFLGRRSCPPSVPVFMSIVHTDLSTAMRAGPLAERCDAGPYRVIIDSTGGDGDSREDHPVSFSSGERRYRRRYVSTSWVAGPVQQSEAQP